MHSRLRLLFYGLFAALIVFADQITKLLVLKNIELHGYIKAIDGLFHLTYLQNTGAAFSSFQGMRWMFVGVFVLLTALLLFEYFKKPLPFSTLDRFCLAAVYGGALGNVIDRIARGYVVDMICVDFMDFTVFNVADCFITCGSILLMIHLIFFNKAFWKDDKK